MTKNSKNIDKSIKMWDLVLVSNGYAELLIFLKNHLEGSLDLLVVNTPNPEQVVLSKQKPEFLAALQSADILLPDGVGLIWASQLLAKRTGGQSLASRLPGVSVVADLCQWAALNHQTILVIGGRGYDDLQKYCPAATWTIGYERVSQPTATEETTVTELINTLKPTIVFVAFGAPDQELWLQTHRPLLAKNKVKLAMSVGGSFDFLLHKVARAPQFMQQLGLEWLYRLYQQPWRWRRQLRLISFIKLTLLEVLQSKNA